MIEEIKSDNFENRHVITTIVPKLGEPPVGYIVYLINGTWGALDLRSMTWKEFTSKDEARESFSDINTFWEAVIKKHGLLTTLSETEFVIQQWDKWVRDKD